MVFLLSNLGAAAVDVTAALCEGTIDLSKYVVTKVLPTNDVHIPGAGVLVCLSEITNDVVKGTENAAVTVEEILVELADITSGAALVRGDDEQPRRGFRAALKEQMGKVGRHFQGAVTDVTTHTLGEDIGKATRLTLSTAGHTVTLGISALQLRSAASPVNFVPLGPKMWRAAGARVGAELIR